MLCLPLLAAALTAVGTPIAEGDEKTPPPSSISALRTAVIQEPRYVSRTPFYGMLVFGPQAEAGTWMVLDQSAPDSPDRDVLFLDQDADGDLTDPEDRIAALPRKPGEAVCRFEVPVLADPAGGPSHRDVRITAVIEDDAPLIRLSLQWSGRWLVRGGFTERTSWWTKLSPSRVSAPVLWPGAEGPLDFKRSEDEPLYIGEWPEFRVYLGHAGWGEDTFCALPMEFLPEPHPVIATLLFTDINGQEQAATSRMTGRCCGVLITGPIRVPSHARPGRAVLKLSLPETAPVQATPTLIPVRLERRPPGTGPR